ncbi:chymotrypsin 1-like protein, partial [Dinothrombium tinctorium]
DFAEEIHCGQSNSKGAYTRIIFGEDAEPGEIPWQVRLRMTFRSPDSVKSSFCGGFIWNRNTIITAAHCVQECPQSPNTNVSIVACIGDRKISDNKDGQVCFNALSYKAHPQYSCTTIKNDIAIIKTQDMKVPYFSDDGYGSTNTICEPSLSDYTGKSLFVSGWGRYSHFHEGISDVLQKAPANVVPLTMCRRIYPGIDSTQVCLQGPEGQSVCNGDSGGPAFYVNQNGFAEAVGIASFATENCPWYGIFVYTSVAAFRDFIDANV